MRSAEEFTILLRVLDELEQREAELLSWGVVDGGVDDDELEELVEKCLADVGDDRFADQVVESLKSLGLIGSFRSSRGTLTRSRSAETVRLLARLRQLFASDLANGRWATAPNLVSDFRFVARPRFFPRRDRDVEDLLEAVGTRTGRAARWERALRALTVGADGTPMTLAPFQVNATAHLLASLTEGAHSSTLVASGTGSGKTLAFYLPALAETAALLSEHAWTKVVSVYPRNELLKDQLANAVSAIRLLRASTGISIRIGPFYGDTPTTHRRLPKSWRQVASGHVCPFLSCPTCGRDLVWREKDRSAGQHVLRCECGDSTTDVELQITRQQMQQRPPDILFTSTEMLNRRIGDDWSRGVFGIGVPVDRRPQFLLLDEVHTYAGPHGAQAALLLRRWRSAVGSPVHTIGLSATIVDGARFLAALTSVPESRVEVIEPLPEELQPDGKEYLIALRGDPASGTALLSTTIQAAMLLRRTLDRQSNPISEGVFGEKLFAFTDDLDVTNRLLHFLRNAEGQTDWGKPLQGRPEGSLANLRSDLFPEHDRRAVQGQAWDLAQQIGFKLDPTETLRVERTSSQDPGLERRADVVVATASLEVGLDDDSVGAVLQHKAPRNSASFVQRRGRAGRTRRMRPWTAVVLSDYGRDRMVYQAWDVLFDPDIAPANLPVDNRYVLRIHATYALLDWLGGRLRADRGMPRGAVWYDVSGPASLRNAQARENVQRRQAAIVELLRSLFDVESSRDELRDYLCGALDVDERTADTLLWGSPRGVLSTVVPTLIRRVESGWLRSASPGKGANADIRAKFNPLPDFVPATLFSDLLLPEVAVVVPPEWQDAEADLQFSSIAQTMREFAPGRVTHRYAVDRSRSRLWIEPPNDSARLDIRSFCDAFEDVGRLDIHDGETPHAVRLVRPLQFRPASPPDDVLDSSNSFQRWRSELTISGHASTEPVPEISGWPSLVSELSFALHRRGGRIRVARVSQSASANVRRKSGASDVSVDYDLDGQPVALGFTIEVDGVALIVRDPGEWRQATQQDEARLRSLRAAYFTDLVRSDAVLSGISNAFQRDWLAQLYTTALVRNAVRDEQSLDTARLALSTRDLRAELGEVLTTVFQAVDQADASPTTSDEVDDLVLGRVHSELLDLLSHDAVGTRLADLATMLTSDTGPHWDEWLRERYLATVASAFASAMTIVFPQADLDELAVDIRPWRSDGTAEVWVTEVKPGGLGSVEGFVDAYREDPRRFWRLVESVLQPSDFEVIDRELRLCLMLGADSGPLAAPMERFRSARGHDARRSSLDEIRGVLADRGVSTSHQVVSGLVNRLMRPGSSEATDALVRDLISDWTTAEDRLGVEIDVRTFAFIASRSDELDRRLAAVAAEVVGDRSHWRFNAILSLLWPRGGAVRSRGLELYQPFATLPRTERTLVLERLTSSIAEVALDDAPIIDDMSRALADAGELAVRAPLQSRPVLRAHMIQRLSNPEHSAFMELYPRIRAVREAGTDLVVELELRDVLA